jgi:mitochondrial fission protein ELM1
MPISDKAGAPPRVWLLMGHRQGDNSQVLALAEALGWPFEVKHFTYRRSELATNLILGATLRGTVPGRSSPLAPPWPDLIITAGRRNEPVARWIQNQAGHRVRIVHIGRPWAQIERFDLIVTSPQYRLPQRRNVLQNEGPIHRITAEKLQSEAAAWRARVAQLPTPWIAVLVGGNSGPYAFDRAAGERLARQAGALAEAKGGALLVTTSARTPAVTTKALAAGIATPNYFFRWQKGATENPYLAFLGLADEIVVTGDSMSMISEAAATGKPVHLFDVGEGANAMCPELAERGGTLGQRLSRCKRRNLNALRLNALLYRLMMRFGPPRLSRDIRLVHRIFVEAGWATWLGQPQPERRPAPPQNVERAVARVQALFDDLPARETAAAQPDRPAVSG